MRKTRRLSREAAVILRLFVSSPRRSWFGLDLIRSTDLVAGTVYPILHRLEQRGLLVSEWEVAGKAFEESRRPRRIYKLTAGAKREAERLIAEAST